MPGTMWHRKQLPAGAHPCGAHPCQVDGDILHGASTQTSTATLCGLSASTPPSPLDADTSQPTCKTCAQIILQG